MDARWSPRLHVAARRPGAGTTPAEVPVPGGTWEEERDSLLDLLAHQQRIAQAGLMTAGLAHDVNNHLQVITGVAYLALAGRNPDEWKSALERIQQQSRDLAEITSTFVSFVKRRDGVASTSFPVAAAVDQVVRLVKPLARQRGVTIVAHTSVPKDLSVRGRAQWIVQALVNLGSNAIRACPERKGRLEFDVGSEVAGRVRIRVSDDGPGIPEDVRRRLFRPFVTSHEAEGGSGLGLYVVRHCVTQLGGVIRVRTSSEGTTFTIELPAASP